MTEQVRSQWKTIWNKDRRLSFDLEGHTSTEIFSELKRIDGFDIQNIPVDGFIKQHDEILSGLKSHGSIKSVFDLGCGSGANLFLFKQEGYKIGGMDYSKPLIEVAKTVLGKDIELICGEANLLPTDIHYDALVANSVFSYFPSLDYAREVLDRMAKKSENMVIVDIHEFGKEEAFTGTGGVSTPTMTTDTRT